MATVKSALHSNQSQQRAESRGSRRPGVRALLYRRRTNPFDAVEWEKRTALIGNEKGVTIFRQEDIDVPKNCRRPPTSWPANIFTASPAARSVKARCAADRPRGQYHCSLGHEGGYFSDNASRDAFKDELTHLLVEQKMAFNSPVWFKRRRTSQAAVLRVLHQLGARRHGIDHGPDRTEGMLFKWGSGTGTNFSALRGSKETLSGGASLLAQSVS